jgi:hypothetical protein
MIARAEGSHGIPACLVFATAASFYFHYEIACMPVDWLFAHISDSRDSKGTRLPSPPISYLTFISFMLHSAIGFSFLFVS